MRKNKENRPSRAGFLLYLIEDILDDGCVKWETGEWKEAEKHLVYPHPVLRGVLPGQTDVGKGLPWPVVRNVEASVIDVNLDATSV